ncbi:MAG: DegT/DnrJ/EryC1/StrS family aminotransferase [bacterium]
MNIITPTNEQGKAFENPGTFKQQPPASEKQIDRSERIRLSCPTLPKSISEIQDELSDLLQSRWLSNFGKYATQLEKRLEGFLGVKYVRTVPNATTGLMILLATLPKNTEVLVPSFTFPVTGHAIVHARLRPRFVDVDPETFNISVEDAAAKISPETSAILAVHTFGNPCRIAELQALAERYHLKLFFDSAPALGSKCHGKLLGSFGDAEVFSMSGTKIVTAGEGGFIATNDERLVLDIDCLRNYGINTNQRNCRLIGYNGKLSELNAVLALKSLDRLNENILRRHQIAAIYKTRLCRIPGLTFQMSMPYNEINNWTFAVQMHPEQFGANADDCQDFLATRNIDTKRYYHPALHQAGAYRAFDGEVLPQSECLANHVLCLPVHSDLTDGQVEKVCKTIIDFQEESKKLWQNSSSAKLAQMALQNPSLLHPNLRLIENEKSASPLPIMID